VVGTFSFDTSTRSALFAVSGQLAPDTTYIVSVDSDGGTVGECFNSKATYRFTTGPMPDEMTLILTNQASKRTLVCAGLLPLTGVQDLLTLQTVCCLRLSNQAETDRARVDEVELHLLMPTGHYQALRTPRDLTFISNMDLLHVRLPGDPVTFLRGPPLPPAPPLPNAQNTTVIIPYRELALDTGTPMHSGVLSTIYKGVCVSASMSV
jgi:hypothetical protein